MEHSPLFLKLRLAMFSLTTLICFIWVILLSCVLFLRWDASSSSERSFLFIFLGIDTLTVVMLLVLLLVKFRTWLDAARLLLLLICHLGMAAAFVVWNPTIPCLGDTPDGRAVCELIHVYLIATSWVPPFLLVLYGVSLAIYAWRYASRPLLGDDETGRVQPSSPSEPVTVTEPMDSFSSGHLSELLASLPSASASDSRRESARKSRLGKRIPDQFF